MVIPRYLNSYEYASQIYLHQLVLVLVLIIIKIYLFTKMILASLKLEENSSLLLCNMANTYSKQLLVTYPQQLSSIINTLLTSFLTSFQHQCQQLTHTIFLVIKALLQFYIEVFLGTYTCLLTAAILGAIQFVSQAIQVATQTLNTSINSIINELQLGMGNISTIINTLLKSFSAIKSLFTNDDLLDSIALVNLTISNLNNINISANLVTQSLDQIELPDFDNLTSKTIDLLSQPFDNLINQSLPTISKLPTISNLNSSQICLPQTIRQFHDNLIQKITKCSNLIIIIISIIILIILISLVIIYHHKFQKFNHLCHDLQSIHDPILIGNLINTYSNPIIYNLLRFKNLPNHYHWWLNYITLSLALTPLFIGFSALIAVTLQFIILRLLSNQSISFHSNHTLTNLTQNYITNVNQLIITNQNLINDQMFGNLLTTSNSINGTLDDFMLDLTLVIDTVFGSTPLSKPLNTIVYCTIGRKINLIGKGIDWLQQNLNLTLPLLPQTKLMTILNQNELNNDSINQINNGLNRIYQNFKKSIMVELYILLTFIALWLLQFIIGAIYISIKLRLNHNKIMFDKPPRISGPKPLSDLEKHRYGYPFTNPYELNYNLNHTSNYTSDHTIISNHTRSDHTIISNFTRSDHTIISNHTRSDHTITSSRYSSDNEKR